MRAEIVLSVAYTFPGGLPRTRLTRASLAIRMFWNEPRICILLNRQNKKEVRSNIVSFQISNTRLKHLRISQYDTGLARIFNSEFGLSVFTSDTANSTRQVIAMQSLDVLDFECVDIKVVQSQKCNSILNFKSKGKCADEISSLLKSTCFLSLLRHLHTDEVNQCY